MRTMLGSYKPMKDVRMAVKPLGMALCMVMSFLDASAGRWGGELQVCELV